MKNEKVSSYIPVSPRLIIYLPDKNTTEILP